MIVDGKAIAADIFRELTNEVSHLDSVPHLTIFSCAPAAPSQKYIALKKKKAETIGIDVQHIDVGSEATTEEMVEAVKRASMQTDGIIVQLPLPDHIDTDAVLAAIPLHLDVDAIRFNGTDMEVLPPVVGAIAEIAHREKLHLGIGTMVIVGEGKLVGAPARLWAELHGWSPQIINELTPYPENIIAKADVLILGAGKARLVTPDMVKEGVIIFDAGTSEDGGVLVGDADPACAEKAAYITPVPGGIGPITLAILFRNLVLLHKKSLKS